MPGMNFSLAMATQAAALCLQLTNQHRSGLHGILSLYESGTANRPMLSAGPRSLPISPPIHLKTTCSPCPALSEAMHALEVARKRDLEWLDAHGLDLHGLDFVVFPEIGDVGWADADVNDASAQHAWTNGVKYSNGNRAIRHLRVPTVSVPMGIMEDIGMLCELDVCRQGIW